jgi:hypothetical protein
MGGFKMNKILKRGIALFLAIVLAAPFINGTQAFAATKKPSLSKTKMTIGVGGTYTVSGVNKWKNDDGSTSWYEKTANNVVSVKNSQKGATYTFTSSNKKVATVKGKGTKGTITGVKKGTATITVKQKYKGKTTTVGKCKITVKQATSVKASPNSKTLAMATTEHPDVIGVSDGIIYATIISIPYRNPKATYTFTSDSDDFQMYLKREYGYDEQYYIAKKAGTYNVTVKETYQKKTRTLGTVQVTVVPVALNSSSKIVIYTDTQSGYDMSGLIDLNNYWISYIVEPATDADKEMLKIEEKSITLDGENYTYTEVNALKIGTVKLNVYYENEDGTKGDLIGTTSVEIKRYPVKSLNVDPLVILYAGGDQEYCYYVYDDLYTLEKGAEAEMGYYYMYPKITYTSSDTSIVVVDEEGLLKSKNKLGEAVVTVTCGDITKEVAVKVIDGDD